MEHTLTAIIIANIYINIKLMILPSFYHLTNQRYINKSVVNWIPISCPFWSNNNIIILVEYVLTSELSFEDVLKEEKKAGGDINIQVNLLYI